MTNSAAHANVTLWPLPAAVDGVRYIGRIMPIIDQGKVVQRVGRSITSLVGHDIANLSRVPVAGEVVDIKYRDGKGIVSEPDLALGVER